MKNIYKLSILAIVFTLSGIIFPITAFGDVGNSGNKIIATTKSSTFINSKINVNNVKDSSGVIGDRITPSLKISNEKLYMLTSGDMFISWDTDKLATSRVVYDGTSHKTINHAVNIGYASSTEEVSILVKKHKMLITGLLPNTQYFFRPISVNDNITKIGNEKTFSLSTSNVNNTKNLTELVMGCPYIEGYLRMGDNNDIGQVKELQEFFKNSEGFSEIKVTGVFGQATYNAVVSFQKKYKKEILTPWGITNPTGYVYYTTQKKINEISCGRNINLTQNQKSEISRANLLINKLREEGKMNKVDINALGRADTTQTKGKIKTTGLAIAGNTKKVESSQNGQIASIVGSIKGNDSSKNGTTTKTVMKKGIFASFFGSVKNGISSVFDSIKRFFVGNSSKEEYIENNISKNKTSTTSTTVASSSEKTEK